MKKKQIKQPKKSTSSKSKPKSKPKSKKKNGSPKPILKSTLQAVSELNRTSKPKNGSSLTIFNHRVNTMAGKMDELFLEGKHTIEDIFKILEKQFGSVGKNRIRRHRWSIKKHFNAETTINDKGIISIKNKKEAIKNAEAKSVSDTK